jgi:molybdopterin synthase catalytic subunit
MPPLPECILVEVLPEPLQLTRYTEFVADPGAGAIATFSGVTRDNFQGKSVLKLEYEAYVPMAEKVMMVRPQMTSDQHLLPNFSHAIQADDAVKDQHTETVITQELCTEATTKWDVRKVALAHKIGLCGVSQTSVIIAVSSAHRREALEVQCAVHAAAEASQLRLAFSSILSGCAVGIQACHWLIDELKARVPIWKKEFFEGGEVWKENAEARRHGSLAV